MSQPSWFDRVPQWVAWAFIPLFGGNALIYAGARCGSYVWVLLGAVFVIMPIALLGILIVDFLKLTTLKVTLFFVGQAALWAMQITVAFMLKRSFLAKTYPKNMPLPDDPQLFALVAAHRHKIDINACSKNDLVNVLGLPIVYANDIDSLRDEGHIFTSLEELHDLIEIPQPTLQRIAPMVVFRYDYRQEAQYSWKRFNTLPAQDLIALGLPPNVAATIVQERQKRGEFKSILDIKKRTGIPFSVYRHLT